MCAARPASLQGKDRPAFANDLIVRKTRYEGGELDAADGE